MKTILMAAGLLLSCTSLWAQKNVEAEAQLDLTSKYMWRGLEKGGASLQPTVKLKWQGAFVSAFGSTGINSDDAKELDLSVGYQAPFGVNIGVTDYWQTGIEKNDIYFEYGKDVTAHRLEGNLGYSCKYGSLQAYCMFYGNDYKIRGDQAFSTYIELTVPFRLSGLDWTAKAGMTPMESAGTFIVNPQGYIINYEYADGPACVLTSLRASKTLDLKGAHMPVYVEVNANPYLKKMHILGGISLRLP